MQTPHTRRHVAAEVRASMARVGLSSSSLARRLGVSDKWVSRRFGAQPSIDPTLRDLEQVAHALGADFRSWLPDGDAFEPQTSQPRTVTR